MLGGRVGCLPHDFLGQLGYQLASAFKLHFLDARGVFLNLVEVQLDLNHSVGALLPPAGFELLFYLSQLEVDVRELVA